MYDIGDMVKCSVEFTDFSNGTLIDPTTVKIKIKQPDFSVLEYTYLVDAGVVKDSTGKYYYNFLTTMDGVHTFGWFGSGNMYAVESSIFFVNPSKF